MNLWMVSTSDLSNKNPRSSFLARRNRANRHQNQNRVDQNLGTALSIGLVVIDIWVILGGMFLEFLALTKLRYSRPDLTRHVRVPGGKVGLWFCVISPIAIGLFALFGSGREYILLGSLALASGPLAYWVCQRFVKGKAGLACLRQHEVS